MNVRFETEIRRLIARKAAIACGDFDADVTDDLSELIEQIDRDIQKWRRIQRAAMRGSDSAMSARSQP